MKTLTILSIVALATFLSSERTVTASVPLAERYKLDPVQSFALFKIKHRDIGYLWGRINSPTGVVDLDWDDPSKCTLELELTAENIDTANMERDQSLKGVAFFNAEQFPTITLKSTVMKKKDDKTYEMVGNLTLLGVTKEVKLTMTHIGTARTGKGDTLVGFEGNCSFKRKDYGMKSTRDHLGNPIGDEVQLVVAFEAVRKAGR